MKDLTINQGDSCYLNITKEDESGEKINFETGEVVKFSAKKNLKQKEYDIESETPIEVKDIKFSTTGIELRVVVPSKTSLDGFDMLAKIRYELVKEYGKANIHFGNYSVEVSQS